MDSVVHLVFTVHGPKYRAFRSLVPVTPGWTCSGTLSVSQLREAGCAQGPDPALASAALCRDCVFGTPLRLSPETKSCWLTMRQMAGPALSLMTHERNAV